MSRHLWCEAMDRKKIYDALFKTNSKGEQEFCQFSQLTLIGQRILYIMINLAIWGSKVKSTIQWLKENNIISSSKSDERTVQHIIHHSKSSGGEIFKKYNESNLNVKEEIQILCHICKFEFNQKCHLDQHISMIHNENIALSCNSDGNDFIKIHP